MTVQRPEGHDDSVFIVSVSGGKDSTATVLALREAGIPARYVFADTGWEAPQTYEYLDTLRRLLEINIDIVRAEGGMRAKMRARAGFPSRMQRWCTRELKVEPLRGYHDLIADAENTETISVTGVRAEESQARSKLAEFEFDGPGERRWNGYVWRPLLRWPVADVLAIHHRHGVPVNPLYKLGFSRVGCWPCMPMASKEDIRLWAEHAPEAVAEARELEREMVGIRQARNAETPGRYAFPDDATIFQARERRPNADGRAYTPMTVDETIAWSRTTRGGKQVVLLRAAPEGGCFSWGLCEPPAPESEVT